MHLLVGPGLASRLRVDEPYHLAVVGDGQDMSAGGGCAADSRLVLHPRGYAVVSDTTFYCSCWDGEKKDAGDLLVSRA